MDFLLALLTTSSMFQGPLLERIEPDAVRPYEGVVLRLRGAGFEDGSVVLIDGRSPGRFLRYLPTRLEEDLCEVELPFGFGPTPSTRRVFLQTPAGRKTEALALDITAIAPSSPEGEPSPAPLADENGGPRIEALRPAVVAPGRPFVLEILGDGFADAVTVEITVNVHAGTSALPEYRPKPFPAVVIDEGLLEVELDRGFYFTPGLRDVVVIDSHGRRSQRASLRIASEEP